MPPLSLYYKTLQSFKENEIFFFCSWEIEELLLLKIFTLVFHLTLKYIFHTLIRSHSLYFPIITWLRTIFNHDKEEFVHLKGQHAIKT